MAISDTISQVKKLADLVESNPGKYTAMLDEAHTAAQQGVELLNKLKGGDVAAVRAALSQWDDVNALLLDSAKMDALNAKGPGITLEDVVGTTEKVLGVAAKVGGLVLEFGPLFGIL